MSFYQRIELLQSEPIDLGKDEAGRSVVGFNIMATRSPSATFIKELMSVLASGISTSSMYGSTNAMLPREGAGPYVTLIATGGPGPINDHNTVGPAFLRSTAQIAVHSADYASALAVAFTALGALAAVTNRTITP